MIDPRALLLFFVSAAGVSFEATPSSLSALSSPSPSQAPPAAVLFVSERDGNPEIYRMEADGSRQTRLTRNDAKDGEPTASRDQIAFVSSQEGQTDLYLMGPWGENPRPLTQDPFKESHPSFSPDGKSLVYASNRDGKFDLYVHPLDGAPIRVVGGNLSKLEPSFSPDGKTILFVGLYEDGKSDLFTLEWDGKNGKNLKNLTQTPLIQERSPCFSPDGKSILFTAFKDGKSDLYLRREDGTIEAMTDTPFSESTPAWGSGGILVSSNESGNWEIVLDDRNLTESKASDSAPAWMEGKAGEAKEFDTPPGR